MCAARDRVPPNQNRLQPPEESVLNEIQRNEHQMKELDRVLNDQQFEIQGDDDATMGASLTNPTPTQSKLPTKKPSENRCAHRTRPADRQQVRRADQSPAHRRRSAADRDGDTTERRHVGLIPPATLPLSNAHTHPTATVRQISAAGPVPDVRDAAVLRPAGLH